MDIVVLDGNTLNPGDLSWEELFKLGDVTIYDRTDDDQIIDRIGNAKIILTNKTPITKEIFEACPSIEYIGVLATGFNVVDVDAAIKSGVVLTNIPTYGTIAVAQFAFALLLELCHHVGEHSREVKKGEWAKSIDFCFWNYPLVELAGKNMGIIGFGKIGQATAKIATSFGMKVLAFDAFPNKQLETDDIKIVALDELLENSDIISLHCPLHPSTKGMINKNSISKMKDGVMIINTSRGLLIVENDLVEALESGKVSGAAVDVLSDEPPKKDNPLVLCEKCIVTPHIAWAPKESRERLMDIAINNVKCFLEGNIQNKVN
jgi:glycerate dehydrogenase